MPNAGFWRALVLHERTLYSNGLISQPSKCVAYEGLLRLHERNGAVSAAAGGPATLVVRFA